MIFLITKSRSPNPGLFMLTRKRTLLCAMALGFSLMIGNASAGVAESFQEGTGDGSSVTPTWNSSIATNDILLGLMPASSTGDFTQEANGSLSLLTDGTSGTYTYAYNPSRNSNLVSAGDGNELVYDLTTPTTLSSIAVYGGWIDTGRDHQDYTISYSTDDGGSYNLLTAVNYYPSATIPSVATQVLITDGSSLADGAEITNLKFDFASTYYGYAEIAAYADTPEPSTFALLGVGMMGLILLLRRHNLRA